jgi:hypothetical protein
MILWQGEQLTPRGVHALENRPDDLLLVPEVVVEVARADARSLRDVVR